MEWLVADVPGSGPARVKDGAIALGRASGERLAVEGAADPMPERRDHAWFLKCHADGRA